MSWIRNPWNGFEQKTKGFQIRHISKSVDNADHSLPIFNDLFEGMEGLDPLVSKKDGGDILHQGAESLGWSPSLSSMNKKFWKKRENCKLYLDWLGNELGIQKPDDWYVIKRGQITKRQGSSMFQNFEDSLCEALKFAYPTHHWYSWKFTPLPEGHWTLLERQKSYFDWLAIQLGIKQMEDWYSVTIKDFGRLGGEFLLNVLYGFSVIRALESIYPDHVWLPWKFAKVPKNFWDSMTNQRRFFDWLGEQLGIKDMEDWYQILHRDVSQRGGAGLMKRYYRDSMIETLENVYPNYDWQSGLFSKTKNGFWKNEENVKNYFYWVSRKLYVTKWTDWYMIPNEAIQQMGAGSILLMYGNLPSALVKLYPQYSWDFRRFNSSKRKSEYFLLNTLRSLFPKETICSNFKHPDLIFEESGLKMELDIFIPSLSLGFEYQGIQHYQYNYISGPQDIRKRRDKEKKLACEINGITLIEVPYWWDWQPSSLVATISEKRKDIPFQIPIGIPIPLKPKERESRHSQRINLKLLGQ